MSLVRSRRIVSKTEVDVLIRRAPPASPRPGDSRASDRHTDGACNTAVCSVPAALRPLAACALRRCVAPRAPHLRGSIQRADGSAAAAALLSLPWRAATCGQPTASTATRTRGGPPRPGGTRRDRRARGRPPGGGPAGAAVLPAAAPFRPQSATSQLRLAEAASRPVARAAWWLARTALLG